MDRDASRTAALGWPFTPWILPIWYAALAYGWWRAIASEGLGAPSGSRAMAPTVALALAGKLAGFLVEAGFYHSFWKGHGRRLPFWRFFSVVATASTADLLARLLAALARRDPGLGPWLAPVAGLELLHRAAWPPALRAAFGSLSLLTLIRLALTGAAQRQALGLSFARVMAWTAGVWLATRVALLFVVDLMSGMSPLPRG
jgi:hypothetical protein